jgi:hypothetical protein
MCRKQKRVCTGFSSVPLFNFLAGLLGLDVITKRLFFRILIDGFGRERVLPIAVCEEGLMQ